MGAIGRRVLDLAGAQRDRDRVGRMMGTETPDRVAEVRLTVCGESASSFDISSTLAPWPAANALTRSPHSGQICGPLRDTDQA